MNNINKINKNNTNIKQNKQIVNRIKTVFPAKSINESMSRMIVSAIICQLDPTLDELADIKTAVSEAVTNSIVHGYKDLDLKEKGEIFLNAEYYDDNSVKIIIRDKGCGIGDVKQAMEPLFTTDQSGERSGMGFSIMQSFSDKLRVISKQGKGKNHGTSVILTKKLIKKGAVIENGKIENIENKDGGE